MSSYPHPAFAGASHTAFADRDVFARGCVCWNHTTEVFADCHTAQGQKVRGTLINARPPSLADEGNKYLA